jgi:hypothetical protein
VGSVEPEVLTTLPCERAVATQTMPSQHAAVLVRCAWTGLTRMRHAATEDTGRRIHSNSLFELLMPRAQSLSGHYRAPALGVPPADATSLNAFNHSLIVSGSSHPQIILGFSPAIAQSD